MKTKENDSVFLTTVEVAKMLCLSPRSLEKMRLANKGPRYLRVSEKHKAKVIYVLSDVIEWVEHCAVSPKTDSDRTKAKALE